MFAIRAIRQLAGGVFLFSAYTAVAAPMQFSKIDTERERFLQVVMAGGQVRIFAEGDIEPETAEEFQQFVEQNRVSHAKVHFNSAGGSLIGALRLGSAIRELGFDTEVQAKDWDYGKPANALCASACAYAFVGGVNRFYSDSAGRLGLHQFSLPTGRVGDLGEAQNISGVLAAYLDKMGAKPLTFIGASRTDSSQMLWLTPDQAVEVGLANNGTQPPTAEIKLVEGVPYLRLEQEHHNATARVLLTCREKKYTIFGGIVTNPEVARDMSGWQHRAYLEFDHEQKYVQSGPGSSKAEDSVLWVDRDVTLEDAQRLVRTNTLGMWVENAGPMRRGAMIDLAPVRNKIEYFLNNCT